MERTDKIESSAVLNRTRKPGMLLRNSDRYRVDVINNAPSLALSLLFFDPIMPSLRE